MIIFSFSYCVLLFVLTPIRTCSSDKRVHLKSTSVKTWTNMILNGFDIETVGDGVKNNECCHVDWNKLSLLKSSCRLKKMSDVAGCDGVDCDFVIGFVIGFVNYFEIVIGYCKTGCVIDYEIANGIVIGPVTGSVNMIVSVIYYWLDS